MENIGQSLVEPLIQGHEVGTDVSFDEVKTLERLRNRVAAEIASSLAVNLDVRLVEPKSIQRSEGKAKRVVDLRNERSE